VVETAYLLGSRARGDAHSDIDLLIVAPSRRPFVERFRDYPNLRAVPVGIDLRSHGSRTHGAPRSRGAALWGAQAGSGADEVGRSQASAVPAEP